MKLVLENFRCHRNATFDIPDSGLVLIFGDNEVGKTTIFKAMLFVLYGFAKKNVCSYRTKTCKVTLETVLENKRVFTIVRTVSKPNTLTVTVGNKRVYTGDDAQSVINSFVGGGLCRLGDPVSCSQFMVSSYVSQLSRNSVISMTPTEQLKFIENLAYDDDTHTRCKTLIKARIKELRAQILTIEGELASSEKMMLSLKKKLGGGNLNNLAKPGVSKEELERKIEKGSSTLKRLNDDYAKVSSQLERYEDDSTRIDKIKEKITILETQLEGFVSDRDTITDILSEEKITDLETQLKKKKELAEHQETYAKFKELLIKINKYKDEHTARIQESIDELQEDVIPDGELGSYTDLPQGEDTISPVLEWILTEYDVETPSKDSALEFLYDKISELEDQLNSVTQSISDQQEDYELSKEIETTYKCPCCSVMLYIPKNPTVVGATTAKRSRGRPKKDAPKPTIQEGYTLLQEKPKDRVVDASLVGTYEDLLVTQASLEKEVAVLRMKVEILESSVDVDTTKSTMYDNHLRAVSKIAKLETRLTKITSDPAISDLTSTARRLKATLPKDFKPKKGFVDTSSELAKTVADEWEKRSSHNRLTREIRAREKELEPLRKKIQESDISPKERRSQLFDTLTTLKKKIDITTNDVNDFKLCLKSVETFETHEQLKEEYHSSKNECNSLKDSLKELNNLLVGAIGLEDAAKEAEVVSISRLISDINEHAKTYLDIFFNTDRIVRLENIKSDSKGGSKFQMNTYVEDNGIPTDLSEISGGALQKCELAFLLAVNDLLGGRILLLDECVNNIDDTTILDIVESLKNLQANTEAYNKLVLVVSHGINVGSFDRVVDVATKKTLVTDETG